MVARLTQSPTLNRPIIRAILPALALLAMAGCGNPMNVDGRYVTRSRLAKGLVVILPGIEGERGANRGIRANLDRSGIAYALAIYDWGFPIPGIGMAINQTNILGNRHAAGVLAERIVEYQQRFPGRPVYLVGHSAGGGIAIFTLEALADMDEAKPIEGAFLLSASISASYKLDKALRKTRKGIVNVYNPNDLALLGAGTILMGNVDGGRGAAAGRTGFTRRYRKVFERKMTARTSGASGLPHFVTTHADVIAARAPAWLTGSTWPPSE